MINCRERIHNPETHHDYPIRQRTTKKGCKGQIMSSYHNSKKKKFNYIIFKKNIILITYILLLGVHT